MAIDLNLDPIKVIINPTNSPQPNEVVEINELLEEVEEIIPPQPVQNQQQLQAPEPPLPLQLQANEANGSFMNGAPLPHLPDLIG